MHPYRTLMIDIVSTIVFTALVIMATKAYGQQYTVTDLGPNFTPMAMNDQGSIVGYITDGRGVIPAWWYRGILEEFPGREGQLVAVNNQHSGVGHFDDPIRIIEAFRWDFFSSAYLLPSPNGSGRTEATGINDAGQISLSVELFDAQGLSTWRAVRLQGETMTVLPSLAGGYELSHGMNSLGDIVVLSGGNDGWHATIHEADGGMIDLGNGGATADGGLFPAAINDAMQVSGNVQTPEGIVYAMRTTPSGVVQRLPFPAGSMSTYAEANSIDWDGAAVGNARWPFRAPPIQRAVLWTPAGEAVELSTRIRSDAPWSITRATHIKHGQILAVGSVVGGQGGIRGVLLTPAPETEPPSIGDAAESDQLSAG